MDILYNKRELFKCIKYLHRHSDARKELHAICETCMQTEIGRKFDANGRLDDFLLSIEDVSERYDAWVEYYYYMDEEFQNCFSEYWFPMGEKFISDLIFIDLLYPNLPIIIFAKQRRICICPSLIQFVKEHRNRNRFYLKWFRTNAAL